MSIESRSRQYGKVFDHWRIREFLGSGSGGKSAVFRLVHTSSSSVQSALKVISLVEKRGDFENLSEARKTEYERVKGKCKEYAEQEVLLMNGLQGRTNVVDYLDHTFIDWVDENGFGCDLLIRMELLKDLRSKIEDDCEFTQEDVLKIGRDICTALVLCHRKNILHRDIKPENIFYNEDGNYKLGDFGVSRILSAVPMSKASTGVCTPEYAAPEQMTGKYDKRVDIYSLGLVLYELSNNKLLPFASSSFITEIEVQERLLGKPIPAPQNAGKALAAVILKACAFNPEDRYQTAEELLLELNYLAGVGSRPVKKTPSSSKETQKAAAPRVGGNATQYAKPDTTRKGVSNQNSYVEPRSNNKGAYQTSKKRKPKKSKMPIVGLALVLILGVGVSIWGIGVVSDHKAITEIIDEVNIFANSNDYTSAISKIEAGLDEYPNSDRLEDKYKEVIELQTDYEVSGIIAEAENLASGADYEGAVAKLEAGLSLYPDSDALQNRLSEFLDILSEEVKVDTLSDAKALADAGEYESAMSLIKAAQELYGTNKEYDEAYAAYHKAHSLSEAGSLARGGDYVGAINVIVNAQKINENDLDLIAAYNSYCDKYVTEVITSADALANEWKIDEAISTINNGLKVIPTNSLLKEKVETLKASKPISITSLDSINSSRWYWDNGEAVDPFGNDYSSACNYVIFHNKSRDERSIEYRIYGDFKTLTGVLSPHKEIDQEGTSTVMVYADEELVYTSPAIGQKTDAFTFSADITNAEYVKIVVEFNKYYVFDVFVDQLIISDVQLWP